MRNIEVSDKMYDFLVDLSRKMNIQDNLATADPAMFIITELVERPAADGCGDRKFIDDEGNEIDFDQFMEEREDDLKKFIEKCGYVSKEINHDLVENFLLDTDEGREVWFDIEREALHKMRTNMFFTKEAIDQHLISNNYHYNEGETYYTGCFRNYELEDVVKFLKGIWTKDLKELNRSREIKLAFSGDFPCSGCKVKISHPDSGKCANERECDAWTIYTKTITNLRDLHGEYPEYNEKLFKLKLLFKEVQKEMHNKEEKNHGN